MILFGLDRHNLQCAVLDRKVDADTSPPMRLTEGDGDLQRGASVVNRGAWTSIRVDAAEKVEAP